MRKKNEKTKQGFKEVLVKNAWPIFTTLAGIIFFVCGYVLSIRADLNATQFRVEALQESTISFQSLITEVEAIKVTTQETKEKVDAIYEYFINN